MPGPDDFREPGRDRRRGDLPEVQAQGINALRPPATDSALADEQIDQSTGERQHRDEEQPRQRNPAGRLSQDNAHRNGNHHQRVQDGDGSGRKERQAHANRGRLVVLTSALRDPP